MKNQEEIKTITRAKSAQEEIDELSQVINLHFDRMEYHVKYAIRVVAVASILVIAIILLR